jgi:hypothetical protein
MIDREQGGNPASAAAAHAQSTPAEIESCPNLAEHSPNLSPELQRIIEAWGSLPLHVRVSIMTLVEAAGR